MQDFLKSSETEYLFTAKQTRRKTWLKAIMHEIFLPFNAVLLLLWYFCSIVLIQAAVPQFADVLRY